jgi:hypothetical protein
MKNPLVELRANLITSTKDSPLVVIINAPEKHSDSGDYFCRVNSTESIPFRLDVYGVTPQQAIRLALELTAAKVSSILLAEETDNLIEEK